MICPHCHTENRPGAKFCNECGQKLDDARECERELGEVAPAAAEEDAEAPAADEVAEAVEVAADEATDAAEVSADETAEANAVAADVAVAAATAVVDEVVEADVAAADEAVGSVEDVCAPADEELPEPLARTGTLPRINIVADKTQVLTPAAPAVSAAPADPVVEVGKTQVLSPVVSAETTGDEAHPGDTAANDAATEDAAAGDGRAAEAGKPSEKTDGSGETEAEAASAEEPARPKADLSGFDEYLVNPGYVPAPSAWRAGDTLQMPALKDVEGPKQKEFKAPADPHKPARKGKGKGGKIAAIVIAVLVVAAAIAAGVTYQMELWGGKVVPDVTGMTQADATSVLEGKGFTVRATSVASDETEGIVLLMDPGANARQQAGSEVVVHVSTSRLVPDVVGKSQETAERLLSGNGFENVTYVQERSDEAAGTVLSISPDAGEKAKAKSAITVTVAEPYTVPDVSGMTPTAAAAAIEEAGLTSRTVTVYNESIPEGYMIGIDPASGSEVTSETVVTISVAKSRGNELTAAARNYLAGGSLKASDGSTFTISSVNSCTYKGNDEVSFTATGVASTSVTVLGQTLSVSGDSKQVSGTIGFDAYNNVVSISFS